MAEGDDNQNRRDGSGVGEAGPEVAREPGEAVPGSSPGAERGPVAPGTEALESRVLAPPRSHVHALPSVVLAPPGASRPQLHEGPGLQPEHEGPGLQPAYEGPGHPPGPPGPHGPSQPPGPGKPGLGTLLAAGLGATVKNPWLVAGLCLSRLLRLAAGWTPLVLLVISVITSLLRDGTVGSPGVWLSLLGLYLTGTLAGWMVELALWSGGISLLDQAIATGGKAPGGSFTRALARTFPRFTGLALIWIGWKLVWTGAAWALLQAAATLYGESLVPGTGGFWPAAALALVGTFFLLSTVLAEWVFRLAIARVGARGDRPLVGLYEGARLLGSHPFPILASLLVLGIVAAFVEQALVSPLAILQPSRSLVVIWIVWQIPLALAAAFVAVWRMGVLVAATRFYPEPLRSTPEAAAQASVSPAAPARASLDPL